MKNYAAIFLFLLLSFVVYSCKKKVAAPSVPVLELVTYSPDSLRSGDPSTQIALQMYVKDGDGDLGNNPDQTQIYDLYIKDARVDSFVGYFFPAIDDEIKNQDGGLEGEILFQLRGDFIFTRDDTIHTTYGDTTTLEIYIKDMAGNESNHVTTGAVYIRP